MNEMPGVGTRVRILPTSCVCDYLHGATGVVESFRFDRCAWRENAVVRLDEPRAPTPHWTPLTHIGMDPRGLEVMA